MLSAAKHLGTSNQILRFAQHDTSRQLRMTPGYDTINTFKAKLPPFGFKMLETIVTTYIDKHQLLPPGVEVIVAVSGGADSLCLLNQLCGPGKRYPGVSLHAAHLNHRLRGEASDREAATVASIVESWGLPCALGEVDVA